MNGLRLVLFHVNSDAGLRAAYPRQPLAFFLGGAPLSLRALSSSSSLGALDEARFVEEPEREIA